MLNIKIDGSNYSYFQTKQKKSQSMCPKNVLRMDLSILKILIVVNSLQLINFLGKVHQDSY